MKIETDHVFKDVDHSGVAPHLVAYLEAVAAIPDVRALHDRAAEMLALQPGERVLEVGCGLGADAREMAAAVEPGGEVVAIDVSKAMLEAARERHDASLPVRYEPGDVTALAYDDESFDVVRIERVLQHVEELERACAEMARVLRPGGRLQAIDTDWGTLAVDITDTALRDRVLPHSTRRMIQPRAALALRRLLTDAGLRDVQLTPWAFCFTELSVARQLLPMLNDEIPPEANFIPQADRAAWFDALNAADANGTLVVSWTAYVALAHKDARTH
ncbi:MAG: methyltransferase domain-containing protein [Mycobacteriales bacterium]|nr:methyltransferase domain-containing protein [Frankia sp.]